MAQESGETDLEAIVSSSIGMAETLAGHYGRAEALLAQAIPRFEQTGNWSEWFQAQGYHGIVLAIMGDHARGLAEIQRAHAQAQEVNALWAIIQSNFFLAAAGVQGGDLPRAMEAACEAVELADHSGNRLYAYVGRFFQTWVADRAGQYEAAAAYAAEALTIARELGEPLIRFDWLAAVRADIALGAGHAEEAVSLAEQAVGIAREMGSITSEGMARRAWGHSLATLAPPQWVEAEAQLAESLRLLEWGQSWLPAARTHMAWGSVCRARGDHVAARAHWEQAAAQWESSGLTHELERTRALIDSCPHPQGSSASTSW
jgi:tetratricopeptide (TPR) repeat protein